MLFWGSFRLLDLVVCGYDGSMATSSTAHLTGSTTNVWILLSVFWVFMFFFVKVPLNSTIEPNLVNMVFIIYPDALYVWVVHLHYVKYGHIQGEM